MRPHLFFLPLAFLLVGCDSADSGDTAGSSDTGSTTDTQQEQRDPPEYSLGECPELEEGTNSFATGESTYDVEIVLPEEPAGAPVLFAWHWLGGTGSQILNYLELEALAEEQGVVVIAPDSDGASQYEWRFTSEAEGNPDLLLFEDLLSCTEATWDVDLDQVFASGMSAGGLWSSYLTIHEARWLAATAPLSGGGDAFTYSTPEDPIPVMLTWGGVTDTYGGYSFHDASLYLSEALRGDGHFVVECEHSDGHNLPPWGFDYVWLFFEAHPKGVDPEPWTDGLPGDMPDGCRLP